MMAEQADSVFADQNLVQFSRLDSIIKRATTASSALISSQLRAAMQDQKVRSEINHGVFIYILAAETLALSGREIEKRQVAKLFDAVRLKVNNDLLDSVSILPRRNHMIYLLSLYFIVAVSGEPSVGAVVDVVRALNVSPDADVARKVIDFYNGFEAEGKGAAEETDPYMIAIEQDIGMVSRMAYTLLQGELRRSVENREIVMYMNKGMMPYLAATCLLSLSGRDTDREGVSEILEAMDITPEERLLGLLSALHYRNHIVYFVAMYFLVSVGIEANVDNLIEVARAMDVNPDATLAAYAIRTYGTLR